MKYQYHSLVPSRSKISTKHDIPFFPDQSTDAPTEIKEDKTLALVIGSTVLLLWNCFSTFVKGAVSLFIVVMCSVGSLCSNVFDFILLSSKEEMSGRKDRKIEKRTRWP
jgi:hypothetical protein